MVLGTNDNIGLLLKYLSSQQSRNQNLFLFYYLILPYFIKPDLKMSHSHDGGHSHSHDNPAADHGHTHEILDGPGSYMGREMPLIEGRDWSERAFTVGIGG